MTPSKLERTRINNRLPVAREGLPFIFFGTGLTVILLCFGLIIPVIIFGVLTIFTIYFFRDPEREFEIDTKAVLTPADGTILEIRDFRDQSNLLGEPAIRISIFMSIFNVHVNRISMSGKISNVSYHAGKFFSANLDKASEQNEHNRIMLETEDGRKIMIVQIAGLIARRIACWINEGDLVKAGQRFGLIRFGSRLDVYIPGDSRVTIQPRKKVKAGQTILGYLS